ncbi:MAG: DeoR/GlpR transcriptional regulator, partial [Bosea sp.]|nr:DeoR/GlpR transcriptional regulator [Bosea sp. (in: a-proteobacteria)]
TSIGGIDTEGNLLEYRDDEAVVGRAMLRNARRAVLLADHSKFSRAAMSRLGHLREFNTLVTDRRPAGGTMQMIREAGCELIVASET